MSRALLNELEAIQKSNNVVAKFARLLGDAVSAPLSELPLFIERLLKLLTTPFTVAILLGGQPFLEATDAAALLFIVGVLRLNSTYWDNLLGLLVVEAYHSHGECEKVVRTVSLTGQMYTTDNTVIPFNSTSILSSRTQWLVKERRNKFKIQEVVIDFRASVAGTNQTLTTVLKK